MSFLANLLPRDRSLSTDARGILLVEASKLFSTVLSHRLDAELGRKVMHCPSRDALARVLANGADDYCLAVVDINLPDSPQGDVLDMTHSLGIPAIIFTATFDRTAFGQMMERNVVDYVIKDSDLALDNVVNAVRRTLGNRETRVLVVDDIDSARRLLAGILAVQQFNVVEARTGTEALRCLEEFPDIQLVITDYHMPDMDGYELTRRLRRQHSSEMLRIIGVSSSADPLLSASFLKAGANDFVYRPFVVEELQCRIAQNVEILTQYRLLRDAAACDYLTGLYNRRYFFDQGPKQVDLCLRADRPVCVAVLDIDHFKRLNDTYGHEVGDRVLIAVARRLSSMLQDKGHLLSRLGGEEFGILLAGLDAEVATSFCDEIRAGIAGVRVAIDEADLSVSVSIGIAEVRGYESFENYLNAADQFLYMAKHRGRNQVYSDYRMTLEPTLDEARSIA